MSEDLWMGMTREEYLLLSYILLQVGPEGEAFVDPDRAAEALGLDPAKVRDLLESLQRKRLISIAVARPGSQAGAPIGRLFDAFRDAQAGPEGFSYFRREVRSVYLGFLRSLRELASAGDSSAVRRALGKALYYNARLEQYRNLGEITLSRLERLRPFTLAGFEEALKALYQLSVYVYPIATLIARQVEAPWGERITVYVPSTKALQARLRNVEDSISGLERLLTGANNASTRRGILVLLAGLRREREILHGLMGLLDELEGVLWP